MAGGYLWVVVTVFVVICGGYNRELNGMFVGKVNFFCFFFGSGDWYVGMVFVRVGGQECFLAIAIWRGYELTMPIADYLAILQGNKGDKAYYGDQLSHIACGDSCMKVREYLRYRIILRFVFIK